MPDRPNLRVVDGGKPDDHDPGSLDTVIGDLEIAHGHVVEATAEAAACEGDTVPLLDTLYVAEAAVTKALAAAHKAKP